MKNHRHTTRLARRLATPLAALLVAGSITAQTASFTRIGTGCGSAPPPLLNSRDVPRIGASFTITYTGPNSQTPVSMDIPVLLTGTQQVSVTIPQFSSIQPANCILYTIPIFTDVMPWTGTRYQDTVTYQIPNDRNLLGANLYQQFVGVYFNCRSTPCLMEMLRTTNGGALVIGL
ncbi:MAG: hypothetical protein H6834_03630 [Planctomycetes bacterium]|nr:hypothetical protein [Planctomycetota bacterium]